jgi:uncharacterized protein
MFFDRVIEPSLVKWKDSIYRKPLIIRGARQVGKTSILKYFGEKHFKDVAYFNFDESADVHQFFTTTKDPKKIIPNLSLVHGRKITKDTLIIFDEIQECPLALNTLKYFNENAPQYAIVCAGSLLGIMLGKSNSFPVGKVEFLDIYPLTFLEFLKESNPKLFKYTKSIKAIEPLPDIFFNEMKDHFKKYLIIGGLPGVAKAWVEHQDLELALKIQSDISTSYKLDFAKHTDTNDVPKINYIWECLPSQLSRENKKFLYQLIKDGARAREYENALLWLEQSGLVYRVNTCKVPRLPMSAYEDLSAFKLYTFDVGVLRHLSNLNPVAFQEGNRLFTEFKGALTENYVLQALQTQIEYPLKYWTSSGIAEVDFLLQYKNDIFPIEVKSDENIRSKSLAYYSQKYEPKLRIRYSLKNLEYNDGLLNIPYFLADKTVELIERALKIKK